MILLPKSVSDRLSSRFQKSAPLPTDLWSVEPSIVPVTLVDSVIGTLTLKRTNQTANAITATGAYAISTLPTNRRRRYLAYIIGINNGVFTMSDVIVGPDAASPGTYVKVVPAGATATQKFYYFNDEPFWLDPGWFIGCIVDGFTTIGEAFIQAVYEEYDA